MGKSMFFQSILGEEKYSQMLCQILP
jgi:hypothetical protein